MKSKINKIKKFLDIFVFLIFVGFFLFFGLGFYLSPQDKLEKSDAIVVISGGEVEARAKEGVTVYKEGYASKVLFSGAAKDPGMSNAYYMGLLALDKGVPEESILLEEESKDTYENALLSKPIIERDNFKKIILVTSPYHQRRAYLCFRKALGKDYKIINHSAKDSIWRKSRWWRRDNGSLQLTLEELRKISYIYLTSNYH